MKTVSSWDHLRPYGIIALTGEACSLMYRILCDLTQKGKTIVERCLSVQIQSDSWNCGSEGDPHVASIMLSEEMIVPLAVFALLDAGCREVWIVEHAAIGIEPNDAEDTVERMKEMRRPRRRFAFNGPFQDRNQHQMSGRVR